MRIASVAVGDGAPLVLIAGLNVIESEAETLEVARLLREIAARHDLPLIFKASFDKANRSSFSSFRGPGLDEGLRVLARVKAETGLPITTDVHEPGQAKPVAEIADCLQIPAFLCRQTDLVAACAATGKPLNFRRASSWLRSTCVMRSKRPDTSVRRMCLSRSAATHSGTTIWSSISAA